MSEQTSKTISMRLLTSTPEARRAKTVYEQLIQMPDPDDPEHTLTAQRILTEALLALGEKIGALEPEPNVRDVIDDLKGEFNNGINEVKSALLNVEQRLDELIKTGVITPSQAKQVSEAIGAPSLTETFARNMQSTFKPGRNNR